jgi:hypothetical protein
MQVLCWSKAETSEREDCERDVHYFDDESSKLV